MTSITPATHTWTLRLKAHKTTVLLHVDPLTRFAVIKQLLYKALQETTLRADRDGPEIPLPSSPEEIQLGRPVKPTDPSEGFQLGEWEYSIEEDEAGSSKGKETAAPGAIQQCPKGAGLKDNAVLAFRFKGDGTEWGSREAEGNDGEEDIDMEADQPGDWGVQIPTFDDSYGEQNAGDVGERRVFQG